MDSESRLIAMPAWVRDLRYSCPACRTEMEIRGDDPPHCPSCGFEARIRYGVFSFVSQTGATEPWQHAYEELAGGPLGDTSAGVQYRSRRQHGYIVAAFRRICGELPADTRVLEVGCGNGLFWQALFPRRAAIGIDYAARMCVLARARGMTTFQADASALPFADDQFDLVYAAEMMQHVSDLATLCTELARVCRSGGKVVISSPNKASFVRRAMALLRHVHPHPVDRKNPPLFLRTAGEVMDAVRGAPLQLQHVCWTHYPLSGQRCLESARNALAPLASNFVIGFTKLAHG